MKPLLAALYIATGVGLQAQSQNPVISAVVNVLSFQAGQPVAPGELVALIGSNLAANPTSCQANPIPITCGGVSALVGGKQAPVLFASSGQLSLQIPYEVSGTGTTIQVSRQSGGQTLQSSSLTVAVAPTAPGISTSGSGAATIGAFLNSSSVPVSASNPAQAGDILTAFGTGFGATATPVATGVPAPANTLVKFAAPVTATVGGQPADVQTAILAPGMVGLAQVNFRVPAGLAAGNQPFVVNVGGVNSPAVMLPVAPPKASPAVSVVISAGEYGAFPAVAPGTWMEIYGTNLSTTTRPWATADFSGANAPTAIDGVKVTIGGQPAFIDFVSPGQLVAQVPSNVSTGSTQLTVTNANGTSTAYNITVNALQPGLRAPASFQLAGKQHVVAQFSDQSYVLPAGALAGVASRPAKPGETIIIYGVGFGPVTTTSNQSIPAGQIVSALNQVTNPVQFQFGGTAGGTTYSGLVYGYVGLYQFNVTVPLVPDSDAVPLTFTQNGVKGSQTLYIAVHQ